MSQKIDAWEDEFGELHRTAEAAEEASSRKALSEAIHKWIKAFDTSDSRGQFSREVWYALEQFMGSWQATTALEALARASRRRYPKV